MLYNRTEYIDAMHYFGWKRARAEMIIDQKIKEGRPLPDSLVVNMRKNEWRAHK